MTLVSSSALHVLETFRVPYRVEPRERDGVAGWIGSRTGAELLWIGADGTSPAGFHSIGGLQLYTSVAPQERMEHALAVLPREWHPADTVVDESGSQVACVWRCGDGSALLPFEPDAVALALLREEYVHADARLSVARDLYYLLRPLVPRRTQLAARRRFARIQERVSFPRWPTETALHDFYRYLLSLLEDVNGAPLPWIAPWPVPFDWAIVLTHDVEREVGYRHVEAVAAVEQAAGVRSAWYFVPERDYSVEDAFIESLSRDGFEICVHGLKHDGRDMSAGTFDERLPAIRSYAEQWGAVGFRAPATQRSWERIARLGFDHDSSYSDVATYEPQPGGSCSWLPFFVDDVVELPITLPMDHTLFELLDAADAEAWFEKAGHLREQGAMALLLTHPDYLVDPGRLAEYKRFVTFASSAEDAWLALPREASSWWRRRAASSLELQNGTWRVTGPAAGDARVVVGAGNRQ